MRKITLVPCVLALMLATPWYYAYADSFSCKGGIISTGDNGSLLFAKCGPPDGTESHIEEVVRWLDQNTTWTELHDDTSTGGNHHKKEILYITVETWTYNLGPDQLIRVVTLKNGQITEIRTGNYGY